MNALGLLLAITLAAPAADGSDVAPVADARSLVLSHALVAPRQEARLPALRAGRLAAFDVREGDEVAEDQTLARIDAAEAEARVVAANEARQAALVEAESSLRVQASDYAARLAELERRLTAQVVAEAPRAVTAVEREETVVRHEQALLQTELERQSLALARHEAAIRGAEADLARIDLAERTLSAPFAGVVAERLVKEHEWVQQGEPVLHLVRLDVVQLEAFVDVAEASPIDLAEKPATLIVAVGPDRVEAFDGTVTFVSPVLEADGAYRIRVEIENRRDRDAWLLRPGMVGALTIALEEPRAVETQEASLENRPQADVGSESPASDDSTIRETTEFDANADRADAVRVAPELVPVPEPAPENAPVIADLAQDFAARTELALDDEIAAALALEDSTANEPLRDEEATDADRR